MPSRKGLCSDLSNNIIDKSMPNESVDFRESYNKLSVKSEWHKISFMQRK
jgi:hypothetical protein